MPAIERRVSPRPTAAGLAAALVLAALVVERVDTGAWPFWLEPGREPGCGWLSGGVLLLAALLCGWRRAPGSAMATALAGAALLARGLGAPAAADPNGDAAAVRVVHRHLEERERTLGEVASRVPTAIEGTAGRAAWFVALGGGPAQRRHRPHAVRAARGGAGVERADHGTPG